jgi:hypothetical protein
MTRLEIWKFSLLVQLVFVLLAVVRCLRDRQPGRLLQGAGIVAVSGLTIVPTRAYVVLWSLINGKYGGNVAEYLRWDHHLLAIVHPEIIGMVSLNFLALLAVGVLGGVVAILELFGSNYRWYWQTVAAFLVGLPAQWLAFVYSMIDG